VRERRPGHVEPQPARLLGIAVEPSAARSPRSSSIRSLSSGRASPPWVNTQGISG
jgi:hypothetical protein